MKYDNAVKEARVAKDYRLSVVFQDGYVGEIDLWPLFEKPRGLLTQPFQDSAFFAQVRVDFGAVAWPNGYDIDPNVLRYYCQLGHVCSREELATAFEQDSVILNDKQKS